MEFTILTETENKPLARKEVRARLLFDGPIPSRKKVRQALTKTLSAQENLIIIRKIQPKFGEMSALINVHVYSDQKVLDKVLTASMKKRHETAKKEEAKEEKPEAPKEEPKVEKKETPKEEPKEAPKVEKKEEPKEKKAEKPAEKKEAPEKKPVEKKAEPKEEVKEAPKEKPAK